MKFRDTETGDVFEDIIDAHGYFCHEFGGPCYKCPVWGGGVSCISYAMRNPIEAAKRMGMEVIKDTPTETHDNVDRPAHYNQGGVECIDALKAATVGLEGIQAFCVANAIKYIWRFKDKNGAEDLDKAIWYIQRLKEEIGNG